MSETIDSNPLEDSPASTGDFDESKLRHTEIRLLVITTVVAALATVLAAISTYFSAVQASYSREALTAGQRGEAFVNFLQAHNAICTETNLILSDVVGWQTDRAENRTTITLSAAAPPESLDLQNKTIGIVEKVNESNYAMNTFEVWVDDEKDVDLLDASYREFRKFERDPGINPKTVVAAVAKNMALCDDLGKYYREWYRSPEKFPLRDAPTYDQVTVAYRPS